MALTDAQLAREFKAGDDLALAAIYQRNKLPLYRFCLHMLGDPASAQDALQETFLQVLRARHQLRHPEKITAWLYAIARNHCRRCLRQRHRRETLTESQPVGVEATTGPPEDGITLRTLIGRLPPPYREVLILREYEQLSYREIAAIVGIRASAVKSRLFKARKQLYVQMNPLVKVR
jgi:RNA polymerase sigma-70 factor, ECF subfamily